MPNYDRRPIEPLKDMWLLDSEGKIVGVQLARASAEKTFIPSSETEGTIDGALSTGALTPASVAATGAVTSSSASAGVGYAAGAGGTVTQITSRTTGVTLNKTTGAITTNTASLAAEAAATFTVTNSAVAIDDTVVVSQRSGSNGGNTAVNVVAVAAGSFNVQVSNNNAAAGTAETGAIVINFAVIKAVAA